LNLVNGEVIGVRISIEVDDITKGITTPKKAEICYKTCADTTDIKGVYW
jgi:hypothetical protein